MQTKSKVQVLLTKPLADKLTMIANANNKSKGVMLRQLIVDDANDRYMRQGFDIFQHATMTFTRFITGVRAYERRGDLRANNSRLLDYVRDGGTLVVQYNKFEFNEAQYGPYPGKVGRERVTDENAEMKVLDPGHPVFNGPNKIGRADWANWVQERGLYFFDEQGRDPNYKDLIEFTVSVTVAMLLGRPRLSTA